MALYLLLIAQNNCIQKKFFFFLEWGGGGGALAGGAPCGRSMLKHFCWDLIWLMVKLNFQIGQFLKLDSKKKGGRGGAACAQVAGCPVVFYCISGEVKQMPSGINE